MDPPGLVVLSLAEVTWERRPQGRRSKHLQGIPQASRRPRGWTLSRTRFLSDPGLRRSLNSIDTLGQSTVSEDFSSQPTSQGQEEAATMDTQA